MEFPVLDKVTDTYLIFSPGIKQGKATFFQLEGGTFCSDLLYTVFQQGLHGDSPQQAMLETDTSVQVPYWWSDLREEED